METNTTSYATAEDVAAAIGRPADAVRRMAREGKIPVVIWAGGGATRRRHPRFVLADVLRALGAVQP